MGLFVIVRHTPLAPAEAWRRLTDWERHTGTVPLTRVGADTLPPTGVGTVVVARTGVGRAAFADPMRVAVWEPPGDGRPGRCRLEKLGRVVTGWAEIDVHPHGTGTAVRWREEARVRGLPRTADAATAYVGRRVFGRVVDTLLAGGDR